MIHFPKAHPLSPRSTRRAYLKDDGRYYRTVKGKEVLAKGVETSDSIYYWWFEYLKRSWKYQKACGHNIELTAEQQAEYDQWWKMHGAQIHKDFGDIFAVDFWDWWTDKEGTNWERGARLFGIRAIEQLTEFASIEDIMGIQDEVREGQYKLIALPTNLNKATLRKRISALLKELEVTPSEEQRARYHPKALKVDADSLRDYLMAFELKQEGKTNVEIGGTFLLGEKELQSLVTDGRKKGNSFDMDLLHKSLKGMSQAEYDAMVASGEDKLAYLTDGKARTATKNYLNVKANRMIKSANANIAAAEQGFFPVSTN